MQHDVTLTRDCSDHKQSLSEIPNFSKASDQPDGSVVTAGVRESSQPPHILAWICPDALLHREAEASRADAEAVDVTGDQLPVQAEDRMGVDRRPVVGHHHLASRGMDSHHDRLDRRLGRPSPWLRGGRR